mgnify:CR=1 FL=1
MTKAKAIVYPTPAKSAKNEASEDRHRCKNCRFHRRNSQADASLHLLPKRRQTLHYSIKITDTDG